MFMKKILAAGMAVVGIVGMVSAQASSVSQGLTNPPTAQMSVSYTVALEAEMEVNANPLNDNDLLIDPTLNYQNLGTIRVKTNYPKWDVDVEAANRLKLKSGGTIVCTPSPVPGGADICAPAGGTVLWHKGDGTTVTDTAFLQVTIGVVDLSKSKWVGGSGANGTTTDFSAALKANPKVGVSKIIGAALTTQSATETYNSQIGADIVSGGFVTPIAKPALNYTADEEGWVTFYVGAGFASGSGRDGIKGKNDEGDYTETLTFTMIAGF